MIDKHTSPESVQVGNQLSFALYGAASRLTRLHRPFLEPMGLTYPQFLVMLTLYEAAPRTMGEIGHELGMDSGTLTPLLKRLVTADLVTRHRDAADDRRVLVSLTEQGEALRADAQAIPGKIEAACLLTDEDMVALKNTLNDLARPPQPAEDQATTSKQENA
ncbi:MarR family winged helix-turn-helix transcriptional regulator [Streptomyces sp. NPDC005055]